MHSFFRLGSLSLLVAVLGCGPSYPVNPVTGIVTMDGTPLPNARVTFIPPQGRPSTGVTDATGRYELRYIRDLRGAEVGRHTVAITTEYEPTPVSEVPTPTPSPPERIPARYNRATTLTAEVQNGRNEIPFALDSK